MRTRKRPDHQGDRHRSSTELGTTSFFAAGVTLTVVSQATRELGVALVVGSLFGLGAFLAQTWNLLREQEFTIQNELVSDVYYRDLRRYAAQMKDISNQIEALEKKGNTMGNG
jgi:hypothetical protein